MDEERDQDESAQSVTEPKGTPPDSDLTFDPAMTDPDEGNLPPESDADPIDESPPDG